MNNEQKPYCVPRELQLQAAMFRLGEVDDQIRSGYEILKKFHKTVTVFGSARTPETNIYYQKAQELTKRLAEQEYTIVTGGGHGIMEAANRGAHDAGKPNIGFNIELPFEQSLNEYVTDSYSFSHFAPRKIALTMMAHAYVCFPGGFGTLDELAEILTLTQTHKIDKAPVILYGSEFWGEFDKFVKNSLLEKEQVISPGDETIYTITDDLDEIVELINNTTTYCDH